MSLDSMMRARRWPLLVLPWALSGLACSSGSDSADENVRRTTQMQCVLSGLPIESATSSSSEAAHLGPQLAIDGDPATRWSSAFSDPQWLTVDLGVPRFVSSVRLVWEDAASADYSILTSEEGTNFTDIYRDTNGNGGTDVISNLDTVARYVRVLSHARTTTWGNSLFEVEVLGDPDASCDVTTPACGDGNVDAAEGETCDDGNTEDLDGCSSSCQLEDELPTIPGRIEAENYDAANELTPAANSGGACDRGDGVDMENTTDPAGGGCNIGWTDAGEWVEWRVAAPTGGSYDVIARAASGAARRLLPPGGRRNFRRFEHLSHEQRLGHFQQCRGGQPDSRRRGAHGALRVGRRQRQFELDRIREEQLRHQCGM